MNNLTEVRNGIKRQAERCPLVRIKGKTGGTFTVLANGKEQDGGGQIYPFLKRFENWELVTHPIQSPVHTAEMSAEDVYPTLRIVRENKVVDLLMPTGELSGREGELAGGVSTPSDGMNTQTFLDEVGLDISLAGGTATVSKRLSRLFSPYRYAVFFDSSAVRLHHSDQLNPKLWDGCGLMSRAFLGRCTEKMLTEIPEARRPLAQAELGRVQRFEITLMHAGGQEKGDVLVVDQMPADVPSNTDFLFPKGSTKREVRFTKGVFVAFRQPRYAKQSLKLDVQSMINLSSFFTPAHLLRWLEADSERFIQDIESGRLDAKMNGLLNTHSADALASLRTWWLGDYFLSGGKAHWFAGVMQALGRQRLKTLRYQTESKLRFPIPGGRAYIFPAAIGGRTLKRGTCLLDTKSATLYVNDDDWLENITERLGGCDGDDAVWLFPFLDSASVIDDIDPVTGAVTQSAPKPKCLVWRSPNQDGEYVVLEIAEESDGVYERIYERVYKHDYDAPLPLMDSRLLPPPAGSEIDLVVQTIPAPARPNLRDVYEQKTVRELKEIARHRGLAGYSRLRKDDLIALLLKSDFAYTVPKMNEAIERARTNTGLIGVYVNVLMVCKALFGRIPRELPASLEAVIDGAVKDGRDLSSVRDWCERVAGQLATKQIPIPYALLGRIDSLTDKRLTISKAHWVDELLNEANLHLEAFMEEIETLSLTATPPKVLFEQGEAWQQPAARVYKAYTVALSRLKGSGIGESQEWVGFGQVHQATLRELAKWDDNQGELFAGLVSHLYMGGLDSATADSVLWQTAALTQAEPVAVRFLDALRGLGLIGEPLWTSVGAVVYYEDASDTSGASDMSGAANQVETALPLRFNGTWFNLMQVAHPEFAYTAMGDVPPRVAGQAKRYLRHKVPSFKGRTLLLEKQGDRLVAKTERGNLFGYIPVCQERLLKGAKTVELGWVRATGDGNVEAVVVL